MDPLLTCASPSPSLRPKFSLGFLPTCQGDSAPRRGGDPKLLRNRLAHHWVTRSVFSNTQTQTNDQENVTYLYSLQHSALTYGYTFLHRRLKTDF